MMSASNVMWSWVWMNKSNDTVRCVTTRSFVFQIIKSDTSKLIWLTRCCYNCNALCNIVTYTGHCYNSTGLYMAANWRRCIDRIYYSFLSNKLNLMNVKNAILLIFSTLLPSRVFNKERAVLIFNMCTRNIPIGYNVCIFWLPMTYLQVVFNL